MHGQRQPSWMLVCATFSVWFLLSDCCTAGVICVDNRKGSDALNGAFGNLVDIRSGPVRTIRRGLQLAANGDTIVLANNGMPYFESIQLVGSRHSGFGKRMFTIVGNGAIIDGAQRVPPAAWMPVAGDLWKLVPWRKGHYQLILDDQPVPEHPLPQGAKTISEIPAGHWSAWRGSIYYRVSGTGPPSQRDFAIAFHDVGLTLYHVYNVRIVDLTLRHFRLDGVSAHSLCRNIVLENVTSTGNGRAGLFVGGTSGVEAVNCTLSGNRRHELLTRGRHAVARVTPEPKQPQKFID